MRLNRLQLSSYRNYESLDLHTDHNVNLFIGPNAQGKTNLLEAIYVLALTKSHRTHKEKELVQWDADRAVIHGEVARKYGTSKLELTISNQGKKAKVNGLEQRRLSSFVGSLNVVMFAPEDLEIVKGSPSVRRRFLDMEIAQVQPSYMHHLLQYQKALSQRNHLLKQMQQGNAQSLGTMLEVWNEQVAEHGTKIMQKRQSFIQKLEVWANRIHGGITGGNEMLRIEYQPSFEIAAFENDATVFEQFMVKLSHVKEQEIRRGATLVGPHRDDLVFFINEKEAHVFGSQGQQRTTALSLKLAEIEFIREEVGEYPILLLDDVLSELDHSRQTKLIETFQNKVQTFITATGVDSANLERLNDVHVFNVLEGKVSSSNGQ